MLKSDSKNNKIKSESEIVRIVSFLKKQGRKIVVYNGSFDIIHAGHIRAFREAKRQGDFLIVLLNSDESIRNYKGPKKPIVPQKERAEILSALTCIDYIYIFNDSTPKKILEKIRPDVYCHGLEWGKNFIEREIIEKYEGKVHFLKSYPGLSTSRLITKIIGAYSVPEVMAVFLDRDGTINVNNPEYVHKIKDFKFLPGVISALKKLSKTDYKIIIITNQSGIARGLYGDKDLKILNKWMISELNKNGVRIDGIYYCPHGLGDNCSCRKPKSGMLLRAMKDFKINLSKSWVIGDEEKDIIMGKEANIKTIKIKNSLSIFVKSKSDYEVEDLLEAVNIILSKNHV